jgi:5-methylcytosine-specific restriction endonuclease McrA
MSMRCVNSTTRRKLRSQAYEREGGNCFYCSEALPIERITLDHIIPLSKGGWTRLDNLVCSCWSCNNKKSNKTAEEFIQQLRSPS